MKNQPLLTTDEALKILFDSAKMPNSQRTLALDDALGGVLATDIKSHISVPSFDNSAVDGYALALKSEQINKPGGLNFKITDRITAGSIGKVLKPGCAARIFTGAAIPKGGNCVIMQEFCELAKDKNSIETWQPLLLNENIRPCGNDIAKNDVILQTGRRLNPADIALAASVGVAKLSIFKQIKVGVFFSGDELVEPGGVLSGGKIFNSNRYALVALLNQLGCEVVNLGNIKDDFSATVQALSALSATCDLIITTGGVSVGEEDYVKNALEKLGDLAFWRIKMKPGKPLAFGKIGQATFIGLPGNPVSVMVTFFLFAQPMIKKMQGIENYKNQKTQVQCGFEWKKQRNRREFVRVKLELGTQPPSAILYPKQDSNVLSSMVWADGLVEIPENISFEKGKILNYYSLMQL